MSQTQKVKNAIAAGIKSIKDIASHTSILEPNIRRILGQGAKKGIFQRLDRGVYTLTTPEGEVRAYVECGKAEEVCPRLADTGLKFDMVFLDVAYYSKNLVRTGNRGIDKYDFMYPQQFADMMAGVSRLMRSDDSHVYLMISNAPSIQGDMHRYIFGMLEHGFKPVNEGLYNKTFRDGSPVTNVRGRKAAAERLMLFSKSGIAREGELPLQLDFTCQRPPIKGSYPTEKAKPFISQIIQQSTFENEITGDFSAGSGVFGECALALNRIVYLIEKLQSAIDDFIIPKLQPFII